MSVLGHLEEFRRRSIVALAAWAAGCAIAWPRAPRLLDRLLEPLGQPAVFLAPAEGFMVVFKLDLAAGALLASPVIAWQVAAFFLPALKRREKRAVVLAAASGVGAFALGAWFAVRFLVPAMMAFFMGFATERLRPQITAERYFGFLLWIAVGCGAAFEFPVVAGGLAAGGLLRARTLLRHWRPAVMICLVVAALVTPSPDAASMLMLAVPLLGVWAAGVGAAWALGR